MRSEAPRAGQETEVPRSAPICGKSASAVSSPVWGKSSSVREDEEVNSEDMADEETKKDAAAVLAVLADSGGAPALAQTPTAEGSAADVQKTPQGLMRRRLLLSGGRTTAAKRRQRRTEQELAEARRILAAEIRTEYTERAKVLRKKVQKVIAELREVSDLLQLEHDRLDAQIAAAVVLREERKRRLKSTTAVAAADDEQAKTGPSTAVETVPAVAHQKAQKPATITEEERQRIAQQYADKAPETLEETGSRKQMRAARRRAEKEAKSNRVARCIRRLQQRRERQRRLNVAEAAGRAASEQNRRRRAKSCYHYEQQGTCGDVELRTEADGQTIRVGKLRATSSGSPCCLPAALLALTKRHTQEVRLDTCAQYSVAGEGLRKYGYCVTRNAPVDIVEGFGGGISRVLGVWRFTGTTRYQQRIVVDALLVEGQGDEFLIGENWMVDKQVKMDFGSRELKYRDEAGQKVILSFTCYGVSSLPQTNGTRRAVVRLAKTMKLATNTRSKWRVAVDAEDGTTGVFLPKAGGRRHLMLAPTVDTVRNGNVRIAVINVEGRREKLPAREALGTWIPADVDMQILSLNGELERARVAEWVQMLRKADAKPLKDEDKLDIGEMEAEDRDLVIALLRQYAYIVEKKAMQRQLCCAVDDTP